MDDSYDVFYCSVCRLCKHPPINQEIKFCSGCKLVQYCSVSHQKEDWPHHKEFCKCIQHIVARTGSKHIYQEASSFTGEISDWNNQRMSVLLLLELVLKRSLNSIEKQIVLFPPVCNTCYSYKPNTMFTCKLCNAVLYCSLTHQLSDKKHQHICKYLSVSFKTDMLRLRTKYFNFVSLESANKLEPLSQLPINMENLFTLSNNSEKRPTDEDILLSEPLSYFLTLLHVIIKVVNMTCKPLTIHIVGADSMEVLAIDTFPIIFYKLGLSNISNINVIMIGPKLSSNISFSSEISDRCSVKIVSNMLYHDYVSSSSYESPDVIAVFNGGFGEFIDTPDKDTWKNSLPCIMSAYDATVVVTSYTEQEAMSDLKRLLKMKTNNIFCNVIVEGQINPFSSLYPHRDWENNGVFYVNKYISVLKT